MTAVLVLWACLASKPEQCQSVVSSEPFTLQQCLVLGQQRAASWIGEHPGYKIAAYRCLAPDRLDAELGRDRT